MGSYNRFPKCDPAADAARRRDEAWRDEQFRRAMRAVPRPRDRIDTSKITGRVFDRSELTELFSASHHPTRH